MNQQEQQQHEGRKEGRKKKEVQREAAILHHLQQRKIRRGIVSSSPSFFGGVGLGEERRAEGFCWLEGFSIRPALASYGARARVTNNTSKINLVKQIIINNFANFPETNLLN